MTWRQMERLYRAAEERRAEDLATLLASRLA